MNVLSVGEKRIPSLAAIGSLLLLLVGLTVATRGVSQFKTLFSFAQAEISPSSPVQTASITNSSFIVYWTTEKESGGAVFYGTSPELEIGVSVDDRDQGGKVGKYLTHFVRLESLKPQTKYYFKIGAGSASFGDPNKNQAPFEVTTAGLITPNNVVDPIYGQVQTSSGTPLAGAIVSWQAVGASPLAALTTKDGSYILPVGTVRNSQLNGFPTFSPSTTETITINDGSGQTANINCVFGKDRPLPTIKIGQNLSCQGQTGLSPSNPPGNSLPTATFKPHSGSFNVLSSSSGTLQLNLVSGQSVSTPFPNFTGKSGPKQMVKIVVHSDSEYSGTVVAGPDGSWSWTPPAGLSPGTHTVTITVVNPDGSTQTITREFNVDINNPLLPVTFGTPSATLTPSPTPTPQVSQAPIATTTPVTGSGETTGLILIFGVVFLFVSAIVFSRLSYV